MACVASRAPASTTSGQDFSHFSRQPEPLHLLPSARPCILILAGSHTKSSAHGRTAPPRCAFDHSFPTGDLLTLANPVRWVTRQCHHNPFPRKHHQNRFWHCFRCAASSKNSDSNKQEIRIRRSSPSVPSRWIFVITEDRAPIWQMHKDGNLVAGAMLCHATINSLRIIMLRLPSDTWLGQVLAFVEVVASRSRGGDLLQQLSFSRGASPCDPCQAFPLRTAASWTSVFACSVDEQACGRHATCVVVHFED